MRKKIILTLIFCLICGILYAEEIGIASYYTIKSSGKITANGETYNEQAMTCASMDYPFNTLLKVTNIKNNKSIICRVNDKGGFKKYGRIIDLTPLAFSKLSDLKKGLIKVKIEKVNKINE